MQLSVNGAAVLAATGGRDFDPERPVLAILHGAGCDHTNWQQQTRYFAHRGYAVLAPDLPAHGLSAGQALASVPALAEWLVSLLDAAGVARATLIGHSLGAQASLEAAARYPERIAALALLGVAARTPVHPELLGAAAANDHLSIDFFTAWDMARMRIAAAIPHLEFGKFRRRSDCRKRPLPVSCRAISGPPTPMKMPWRRRTKCNARHFSCWARRTG